MVTLVLGCADPEEPTPVPEPVSATELLFRASLDVRGRRPDRWELDRVASEPARLERLLDGLFRGDDFARRVEDLYAEVFLTRTESLVIEGSAYGLDDVEFQRSVGDEVPKILAEVVASGRPWTDVVTADWTMSNEVLAAAWPIEWEEGRTGWRRTRYTDGRPAAGVLATNSLWWRYVSPLTNANRGRANAISRILLCHDYLERPVEFDRSTNLLDEEAVSVALTNNATCQNCHHSLDPFASYLFGFWYYFNTSAFDARRYHPGRESLWREYTGTPPAYFGTPGDGLADLGRSIAADPRFVECATRRAWELMLRRPATSEDSAALTKHRDAFIAGGLLLPALYRSILDDPMYRSGDTSVDGYVGKKMMSAELLASSTEALTGFGWEYQGRDMLRSDEQGYQSLAGGADGAHVVEPAVTPNTTVLLVQERLAELAATYVVDVEPDRLFTLDPTAPPASSGELRGQVADFHRAVFGRQVDVEGEEVAAGEMLWQEVYAMDSDAGAAWIAVLSSLLRDPDVLFY
jgi:hypothetical protein